MDVCLVKFLLLFALLVENCRHLQKNGEVGSTNLVRRLVIDLVAKSVQFTDRIDTGIGNSGRSIQKQSIHISEYQNKDEEHELKKRLVEEENCIGIK